MPLTNRLIFSQQEGHIDVEIEDVVLNCHAELVHIEPDASALVIKLPTRKKYLGMGRSSGTQPAEYRVYRVHGVELGEGIVAVNATPICFFEVRSGEVDSTLPLLNFMSSRVEGGIRGEGVYAG